MLRLCNCQVSRFCLSILADPKSPFPGVSFGGTPWRLRKDIAHLLSKAGSLWMAFFQWELL